MHKNHNSSLSIFGVTLYFPLIIFDTMSCPLYNLKAVKDFSMKLGTLIKLDKTMSCTRTITLTSVFLELFPFDYFRYNFVSAV